MADSLDTVAFLMGLEEDGVELSEQESAQLKQIFSAPANFRWSPPDSRLLWPDEVVVFGLSEQRVLFRVALGGKYGVGCMSQLGRVENTRVYASLSRALFAFPNHECTGGTEE